MTTAGTPAEERGGPIDVDALERWMDQVELPGVGAPMEVGFISGGSHNEIFEIRRGDFHCALRTPPRSAPAPRDEGILREWRIIDALTGSDVPHTDAVALCEDASVLGRPFYLMGFVDGWSPMGRDRLPEPLASELQGFGPVVLSLMASAAEMAESSTYPSTTSGVVSRG